MCENCETMERRTRAVINVLRDQESVIEGLRAELQLSKLERRRVIRGSLVQRLIERLEQYEDYEKVAQIVGAHLDYTETDRARRG